MSEKNVKKRGKELTAHIVRAVFRQQFRHLRVLVINNKIIMENTSAIFFRFCCAPFPLSSFFFCFLFFLGSRTVLFRITYRMRQIVFIRLFVFFFVFYYYYLFHFSVNVYGWVWDCAGYHFYSALSRKCVICFAPIQNNSNNIFSQPMSFNVDTNENMHK